MALQVAGLLCLFLVAGAQAHSVFFVDSKDGAYLSSAPATKLRSRSLAATVSALTGLQPRDLDFEAAQQVKQLVKDSPLRKPKAHVVLNIAGLSQDDVLSAFGDARQRVPVDVECDQHVATETQTMVMDFAAMNPGVDIMPMEQLVEQTCTGEDCLQQHMRGAAGCMGGKHTEDNQFVLADGTALDLAQLADRLFATELATMYAGVKAQVDAAAQQDEQDIQVVEMTLGGVQSLGAAYGADSQQARAARKAVGQLMQWSVENLDAAYAGDVTYQVATFDALPTTDVLVWQQTRRSRMLAATNTTASETAQAKVFSAKAAGYGGFIILLYFLLAGVYCLCNMPFKVDTLLFGAAKKTD